MAAPRFLQRLFADEAQRRDLARSKDRQTESAGNHTAVRGEGAVNSIEQEINQTKDNQAVEYVDEDCTEAGSDIPPALSYSSSSTTSEPSPIDADTDTLDDGWHSTSPTPTPPATACTVVAATKSKTLSSPNSPSSADMAFTTAQRGNSTHYYLHQPHFSPSDASFSYSQAGSSAFSSPASAFSYASSSYSGYTSSSSYSNLHTFALPPASLGLPPSSSSSSLTPTVTPPSTSLLSSPDSKATRTDIVDGEHDDGDDEEDDQEELLQPPDNFAMVSAHLYRSSFPKKQNFSFLRSLGLKTVL